MYFSPSNKSFLKLSNNITDSNSNSCKINKEDFDFKNKINFTTFDKNNILDYSYYKERSTSANVYNSNNTNNSITNDTNLLNKNKYDKLSKIVSRTNTEYNNIDKNYNRIDVQKAILTYI